jgi:hypothetical protein
MFFVKITTLENNSYIINLQQVTLLNRGHRRINDVDKEVCSITYDMGGGSVTSFTVDCTLEQFQSFMEDFFSWTNTTRPSLTEFLIATRSPKFTVGDTVKVTDTEHSRYADVGYIIPKPDSLNPQNNTVFAVQFTNENRHFTHLLRENQLEHFTQETQSCDGNGKDQSTEE